MANKQLPEAMAANNQVKDVIAFIKLLEQLSEIQKAKLESSARFRRRNSRAWLSVCP